MPRPDYIRCIRDPRQPKQGILPGTWCGRTAESFEWLFQNIDHAVLNAQANGRLLVCKECWNTIVEAMEKGVEG